MKSPLEIALEVEDPIFTEQENKANPPPAEGAASENFIAGALVVAPADTVAALDAAQVDSAAFTQAIPRAIYTAAVGLMEDDQPIDAASIAHRMEGDEIQNLEEIARRMDGCSTAAHVPYHVAVIAGAQARREMLAQVADAHKDLKKGKPLDEVAGALQRAAGRASGRRARDLPAQDAADYLETEPPPIDAIIENLFEMGDKIEEVGGSKRRKSFLAIEIAIHVATGRDWLGLRVPKRRRVLLVNLELKDKWIHRRIRRACRALGIDPATLRGWLRVINARGRGSSIRARLVDLAARERAELVIVDPRYKLHNPGEVENAGEGLQGILDLLDRVAESGPAVLTVHHDAKGDSGDKAIADRGAGSGWSGRDVDARIVLTPQKQDPDEASVISIMARNFAPIPDFTVRWENDRFILDGALQPVPFTSWDRKKAIAGAGARPPESIEADAIAAARTPLSRSELITKLQVAGAGREAARAALDSLVRRGEIVCTPRAGSPNGAVKYGTPKAIQEYMNPRLKV